MSSTPVPPTELSTDQANTPQKTIVGILLAAGFSTRFGSQKLAHTLDSGLTLAETSALHLTQAIPRCLAVTRESMQLGERLARLGMDVRYCPDSCSPDTHISMSDSLKWAIQAAQVYQPDGYVIALADMPCISPATIQQVAQALAQGASIVLPTYQGQRGHPVGFSNEHTEALLQITGDEGAKRVVQANPSKWLVLPCEDAGILQDIDTPEAWEQLLQSPPRPSVLNKRSNGLFP